MSLILPVVHLVDALPAPMPQTPGVNILPAPTRILSAAPAIVSVAGNSLGAVVNPIVASAVSSVAVPPKTVPAAGLPSANTGPSPLLGGLVGGVVAPPASPSSGPGILDGLLPVTSPLGGALTGLAGVLNNAVGGVADTVGVVASSVGLGDVGIAVEAVGTVVGGVAGDTLSAADNILFGSRVTGALPTGVAGAPLVTVPKAPNVLDPAPLATNVLSPALSAITDVLNSALLPATDVLDPAFPLATNLLALPGDVVDTIALLATNPLALPLATGTLTIPKDILGLLSATNIISNVQSLPIDALAVPTGIIDNIPPTTGPGLGADQGVPLYLLTDLPSDILGSLSLNQYGDGHLSALSSLSPDALSTLPQDVLSLIDLGVLPSTLPTSGSLGAVVSDVLGGVLNGDIIPSLTNIVPSDVLNTLQTSILGILPSFSNVPDLTSVLGQNALPLATALPLVSNLLNDAGILGVITSGLLPALPTSAPSVGGIGIDTPILDTVPPFNIPGILPNIPSFGAQAVPSLVNSLLPAVAGLLPSIPITSGLPLSSAASAVSQIDSILNILKPSDVGLLTSVPNLLAQTLNDAAQHLSPNDPKFPGWQAFGCFTSNNAFDSTLTLVNAIAGTAVVDMTPQVCIARCVAQDANYALVIDDSCFCSAVAPPADAGSNQCTTRCAGDTYFACGNPGVGAYSVFKCLITPENLVPLPLRTGVNGYQYSGCYYGNGFVANAALVTSASTSISDCSNRASQQGYRYAALQDTTCYLSRTNIAASLEAGIGLCSISCSRNTSEACGGTALAVNTGVDLTQLITLYTANPSAITSPAPNPDTDSTNPTGPGGGFVGGCVDATALILATLTNGRQFSNPDNSGALCYT